MSSLSTVETTNPYGVLEVCPKFGIPDDREQYTFAGTMAIGVEYTLSFWVKSDEIGSLIINSTTIPTDSTWTHHIFTFTADSNDLVFDFGSVGGYYFCQVQLELGNIRTDYSPAPEDLQETLEEVTQNAHNAQQTANGAAEQIAYAESRIQQLADSIAMMVRDGTSGSLIKQDANGLYYFDISGIEQNISANAGELADLHGLVLDADGRIDILNSTAEALQKRTEYVRSYTDENDQPCLELGEGDSKFKVFLTNTELRFEDGGSIPAYISNQKLYIEKAEVINELQFGGYVWKIRSNGNMGLIWKGADA